MRPAPNAAAAGPRHGRSPAAGVPAAGERVTWLGHATVLVEAGGARLLTDPVLRRRIGHLVRDPPLPAAPAPLDALLVSHLHHDHFDLPTIRRLDPRATLVMPRGALRLRSVRRLRREVLEVEPGDVVSFAGAAVHAVPAEHDGRRTPASPRTPSLGFVIDGASRVYFAGDTEVFEGMRDIGIGIEVALLPVAGWGPKTGPGHMDADEAAVAASLLQPEVAVPIHWGTLRRADLRGSGPGPPQRFVERVAHEAPGVRVVVLEPGASLPL